MTNRLVPFSIALLGMVASPALAAAADAPTSTQTSTGTTTATDGTSTGVGNAGSFGIASGTSNSTSNATATSNGIQEANTYNVVDNSVSTKTMSTQELKASTTNNTITINAGANAANSPLPSSSNNIGNSAFANYSGILATGWNTGAAANAMAANSIAANGGLTQK